MIEYCIRIDELKDDDYVRIAEWSKKQGNVIGCREDVSGNKHVHLWLKSDKNIQAIRANFKYAFPSHKGNGSYSIKVDKGNLKYLCKGVDPINGNREVQIFVNEGMNISEDDIKQANQQWWAEYCEYQNNPKMPNNKKKQKTESQKSNFYKALDYCYEQGITAASDGWAIVKCLINYYRECVKCEPNDFQLRLMAKSVQTHMVYNKCKEIDMMHIYESLLDKRAREIIGDSWTFEWPAKIKI